MGIEALRAIRYTFYESSKFHFSCGAVKLFFNMVSCFLFFIKAIGIVVGFFVLLKYGLMAMNYINNYVANTFHIRNLVVQRYIEFNIKNMSNSYYIVSKVLIVIVKGR